MPEAIINAETNTLGTMISPRRGSSGQKRMESRSTRVGEQYFSNCFRLRSSGPSSRTSGTAAVAPFPFLFERSIRIFHGILYIRRRQTTFDSFCPGLKAEEEAWKGGGAGRRVVQRQSGADPGSCIQTMGYISSALWHREN